MIAVGSDEVLPSLPGIERALSSSQAIGAGAACDRAQGAELLIVDDGFGSWSCASAVELGDSRGRQADHRRDAGRGVRRRAPGRGACRSSSRACAARRSTFGPLTALEAITDDGAELRSVISQRTETIGADTVIVVGERRARDWTRAGAGHRDGAA